MANRQRAEVNATGADGTMYRFWMGTGALCTLEETLNSDAYALIDQIQNGKLRVGTLREFVKVAAVNDNGGGAWTNADANSVIDNVGVIPMLATMMDSLMLTLNIPKKNEPAAEPVDAVVKRKRGRPAGSGTSKPAAS